MALLMDALHWSTPLASYSISIKPIIVYIYNNEIIIVIMIASAQLLIQLIILTCD